MRIAGSCAGAQRYLRRRMKCSWPSEELIAFHCQVPEFVHIQSVSACRLPGAEKLGGGEAGAILLAKEVGADIVLTDDRKARAAA
jgi:predicted nucleic acid-binding protein